MTKSYPSFQPPEKHGLANKDNDIKLSPRDYQNEIYKKALEENTIAVLETGAGKTLVSVLLIKHMLSVEQERKAKETNYKKKSTFLFTEKVPLVFQQADVIKRNCNARVEYMCGDMNVDVWSKEKWRTSYDNSDVCVMTAQIFLGTLRKAFLRMDEVNLMIFDECHHAVKRHSYKTYYGEIL